jgi:hypothetical protein
MRVPRRHRIAPEVMPELQFDPPTARSTTLGIGGQGVRRRLLGEGDWRWGARRRAWETQGCTPAGL